MAETDNTAEPDPQQPGSSLNAGDAYRGCCRMIGIFINRELAGTAVFAAMLGAVVKWRLDLRGGDAIGQISLVLLAVAVWLVYVLVTRRWYAERRHWENTARRLEACSRLSEHQKPFSNHDDFDELVSGSPSGRCLAFRIRSRNWVFTFSCIRGGLHAERRAIASPSDSRRYCVRIRCPWFPTGWRIRPLGIRLVQTASGIGILILLLMTIGRVIKYGNEAQKSDRVRQATTQATTQTTTQRIIQTTIQSTTQTEDTRR